MRRQFSMHIFLHWRINWKLRVIYTLPDFSVERETEMQTWTQTELISQKETWTSSSHFETLEHIFHNLEFSSGTKLSWTTIEVSPQLRSATAMVVTSIEGYKYKRWIKMAQTVIVHANTVSLTTPGKMSWFP